MHIRDFSNFASTDIKKCISQKMAHRRFSSIHRRNWKIFWRKKKHSGAAKWCRNSEGTSGFCLNLFFFKTLRTFKLNFLKTVLSHFLTLKDTPVKPIYFHVFANNSDKFQKSKKVSKFKRKLFRLIVGLCRLHHKLIIL